MTVRRISQTGFSLVEALIPLTVAGVLLGSALPTLVGLKERHRLEGTAAQLETDIQLARATAVARNEVLRMDFLQEPGGDGCYVVHDGAPGDCTCTADGPDCVPEVTPLRTVLLPMAQPLSLQTNVRGVSFDPTGRTVTPTATLRLHGRAGTLHLVVNVMGRTRTCTPDEALPGQRRC